MLSTIKKAYWLSKVGDQLISILFLLILTIIQGISVRKSGFRSIFLIFHIIMFDILRAQTIDIVVIRLFPRAKLFISGIF